MNPPHVPRGGRRWFRSLLALLVALLLWCAPLSAGDESGPTEVMVRSGFEVSWPVFLMALACVLWWRYHRMRDPRGTRRWNEAEATASAPYSKEQITQTFVSSLPTLTRELNLEVATSKQTELLEVSDNKKVLGLNLGTNTAQVRVAVTYRYHLRLHENWHLDAQCETLVVHAPPLRPSLPPAIHTDEMSVQQTRGWLRLPSSELLEELQRNLTPTLTKYASDPRRVALVRETARQSVAEFVQHWLERESHWRPGRFTAIAVRFADEPLLPAPPTVRRLPDQ